MIHKATGEVTPIVARMGVYFVQMRVPACMVDQTMDFHRRDHELRVA